jgi:hypothetical protein
MDDLDHLVTLAIKHLGITTPVVAAVVKNEVLHLTLLGGQELSCKLSDLEHNRKGAPQKQSGQAPNAKKNKLLS